MTALELTLPADEIASLLRSRALAGARMAGSRPRQHVLRLIWHDTPDAQLAAKGLALVEQRGAWQIERMDPLEFPWPPASPAPVLAAAASRAELTGAPSETMSIAAFDGRERVIHLNGDSPITLTLRDGSLRCVARTAPSCRIVLEGDPDAVLSLARKLALAHKLTVPRASLAAEARALAVGEPAQPRRTGVPTCSPDMTVSDALSHISGHLTDLILAWGDRVPTTETPEAVHQMRVSSRRLRSALSVFGRVVTGPTLAEANSELRALATRLGPARDWDVFLTGDGAAIAALFEGDGRIAALLGAARRERAQAYAALRAWLASPAWRELAVSLAGLAALRPWHAVEDELDPAFNTADLPVSSFGPQEIRRRMRAMMRAGEAFDTLDDEAFHALRKRSKRLRYATDFFAPVLPSKPTRRLLDRLGVLQEEMGRVNDAAVAAHLMENLARSGGASWAGGVVAGYLAARSAKGRARSADAWARFCKLDPP